MRIPLLLTLGAAVLVGGCQSPVMRPDAAAAEAPAKAAPALPFTAPPAGPAELDDDIVYSYLVGELGAQRGDLGVAYGHYLHAAILAHDPYAAERAARIAIFRKDTPAAQRATRRWVELAPNDPQARLAATVLFLDADPPGESLTQAEALIKIADALGEDGYLQVATALGKSHQGAAALQLMRELTARHDSDARAHFALAVVEVGARETAAAEASLRHAMALKPDWAKPWVLLARVMASQDRDAEARALLQKGVQTYPKDTLLRTAYARTLVDAEEYAEALEQFRELRRLAPDDDEILYAQAVLAMQAERWDEARDAWQALRNLGKRYEEATYYLAQIEEENGNPLVATGLYATIQKGPLQVDAALRLAALKAKSGQVAEARDVLRQIRVLEPDRAVDAYLTETRLLGQFGSEQQTLEVYDTALQAYPDNGDLLYNRAIYAAELGKVDMAERDLKRVLQKNPDNADALNALGYTLADQTQRFDEAYGYIQRAYKLKPDSPAILDSMGWVYFRMGKLEQAREFLTKALQRMQDPEIAAHLGEVLWVSGDQAEARRVWKDALTASPDDPKLRTVMERYE